MSSLKKGVENFIHANLRVIPGGSDGKESACKAEDLSSIPALESTPGEGNGNPLQYSCLENPRQRSLMSYSPWGYKELEMTEATWHGTFRSV